VTEQDCQMAHFQTKNPKFGKFLGSCNGRCLYFMTIWLFFCRLVYFVAIWYIFWLFGTFFHVLARCTKNNLAAL
jgi:hypothetical protein